MDCRRLTDDLLLDHSERRLNRDTRKQVEKHLHGCAPCGDRFEEVQSIARAMARTLAPNPPAELVAQLDAAILKGAPPPVLRRLHPAFWSVAGIAAAAAVVLALVSWANRHETSIEPELVGKPPNVNPPPVEPPRPAPPKPQPPREVIATPDPKAEPPKPEPPKPEPQIVNKYPRPEPPIDPEPEPPKPEPKPEPIPVPVLVKLGDLNGDGKIDIADRMILTAVLNDEEEGDLKIADLNNDGKIDVADAQILSEMIAESR